MGGVKEDEDEEVVVVVVEELELELEEEEEEEEEEDEEEEEEEEESASCLFQSFSSFEQPTVSRLVIPQNTSSNTFARISFECGLFGSKLTLEDVSILDVEDLDREEVTEQSIVPLKLIHVFLVLWSTPLLTM